MFTGLSGYWILLLLRCRDTGYCALPHSKQRNIPRLGLTHRHHPTAGVSIPAAAPVTCGGGMREGGRRACLLVYTLLLAAGNAKATPKEAICTFIISSLNSLIKRAYTIRYRYRYNPPRLVPHVSPFSVVAINHRSVMNEAM